MSSSKIIKNHTGPVHKWELPTVEGAQLIESNHGEVNGNRVTAKQLGEIQEQAYQEARQEGFEKGYNDGLERAKKDTVQHEQEIVNKLETLDLVMNKLSKPFEELDQQVETELVRLAMIIAQQIIRREIKTDPGQIIAVVREAIALLPTAARNMRLFLHPDDALLVREVLSIPDKHPQWEIVEDPGLERGGCRVVTETSQVDATLENRITTMITKVLGGEREHD